jgi:hypothetical protein
MMQRQGWTLLFHPCLLSQLAKLKAAAERAELADLSRPVSNLST